MITLLKVSVLTASKSAFSEHTTFNRTRCTTITANQPIMKPVRLLSIGKYVLYILKWDNKR